MCGIAGIINYNGLDLNRLITSLRHRGPDDQTVFTENNIALIHTRLSIQDPQFGVQPFHFANYTIIFNGEIYNHKALRSHLKEFFFKTNSDTETLLYLYIKYKEKIFDLLDGMFAFCIYDKTQQKLFLARDRAGKKPLYYYQTQNRFIFASELNAIKAITPLTIFPEAIDCYLKLGFIWQPYTAYAGVYELPAASYLAIDINNLEHQQHTYFSIAEYYAMGSHTIRDIISTTRLLEHKLKQSVADRLTASDVEVGVFLSGGIDSNLIAAIASEIKPGLKSFTVKFAGTYDESQLAKLTAQRYRTNHIELSINDLSEDVEKILVSYGEPFMDSSAIPSYYVAREASKYVKVVLSGDGADELFGGYRRYVPIAYNILKYASLFSPLLKILPRPKTKQSLYNYFYRLLIMANKQKHDSFNYYLSATTDIFVDVCSIKHNKITEDLEKYIHKTFTNTLLSPLKSMLLLDFNIILFCNLLIKTDIAAMA